MDWAKAKTVLIIAFIITNIILGYDLYLNKFKNDKDIYFQKEYINYFNNLLETKNIKLSCELPKDTPKLRKISVKYESLEERNFRDVFQKSNHLRIIGNKKILYTGKVFLQGFNENEIKLQAERFLINHKFNNDASFNYIIKRSGFFELMYSGKYKNYFLEESYMKFKFYSNGDVTFERLWLIPIEEKEDVQKKKIITSVEAIINTFDRIDENSIIEEIKLGYYYFKLDKNMNLESTQKATAFPAWRIKTNNNKYYYVQAFDF